MGTHIEYRGAEQDLSGLTETFNGKSTWLHLSGKNQTGYFLFKEPQTWRDAVPE